MFAGVGGMHEAVAAVAAAERSRNPVVANGEGSAGPACCEQNCTLF